MSGTIIRAVPKRFYDFYNGGNGMNSLGEQVQLTVATGIHVSEYREVNLVVRIHSFNAGNTAAAFQVDAYPEAPTDEDPGADFASSSSIASTGQVTFATVSRAPWVKIVQVFSPTTYFGAFLRLKLTAIQSSGSLSNPFNFAMSIDVNPKSI